VGAALAAALVCGAARDAAAAGAACACVVDRYEPLPAGSTFFAADSLETFSGNGRPAAGAVTSTALNPLNVYNADGSVRTHLLALQVMTAIGASYVTYNRLRFSFTAPIFWNFGQGGTFGGTTFPPPKGYPTLGDVRAGVDVKILGGGSKSPQRLAAGLDVSVPTGDPDNYSGTGTSHLQPNVAYSGFIGSPAVNAFKLKYAVRGSATFQPSVSTAPSVLRRCSTALPAFLS
jgi:hypothetical protein